MQSMKSFPTTTIKSSEEHEIMTFEAKNLKS